MVNSLEYGIGRNPEQWVMFQRMWDDQLAPNLSEIVSASDPGESSLPTEIIAEIA